MADLKIGSLCSGYGGLDLAVMDVVDADVAWHCQYDPDDKHQYAARILDAHWPGVPNHGDITAVDWNSVEPIDVLTAGFPCQDLSLAGRRAGMREGNRSGLWFHVARAIEVLQPSLVVIENVPGLLSQSATAPDGGVEPCPCCMGDTHPVPVLRALGAVLGDLARLGFDAEWTSLDASEVGAPHKRRRVFLLAWPADAPGPRLEVRGEGRPGGAAAPDTAHVGHERGRQARLRGTGPADGGVAVADASGRELQRRGGLGVLGGPAPAEPRQEDQRERAGNAVEHRGAAPADTDDQRPAEVQAGADRQHRQRPPGGRGAVQSARSDRDRDADRGRATQEPAAGDGPSASNPGDPGRLHFWGPYAPAIERWEHVIRPAPAPTEPGKTGELLSPRFVEWMQGAPDGWITGIPGIPRTAQLKAGGNGVVRQQGAAAFRMLLARREADHG